MQLWVSRVVLNDASGAPSAEVCPFVPNSVLTLL